jgi:hypothetical protein
MVEGLQEAGVREGDKNFRLSVEAVGPWKSGNFRFGSSLCENSSTFSHEPILFTFSSPQTACSEKISLCAIVCKNSLGFRTASVDLTRSQVTAGTVGHGPTYAFSLRPFSARISPVVSPRCPS